MSSSSRNYFTNTENLPKAQEILKELRSLCSKKPSTFPTPASADEFHLKLHSLYTDIISNFPAISVENKLELDMWNTLYKSQIDVLQNALHGRVHGAKMMNVEGKPYSVMELKLRFILLLDRAAGAYLVLLQRLLHQMPSNKWPKSVLGSVTSLKAPIGICKLNQLGRTSGRFDLDLTTFSALEHCTALNSGLPRSRRHRDEIVENTNPSRPPDFVIPRILSRGDRLPSTDAATPQQHQELDAVGNKSSSHETNQSEDVSAAGNAVCDPPVLSTEVSVIYLIQHCLIHLGDVARYRQQLEVAAGYYIWSWIVHPSSGHPHNQLAILESAKGSKKRLDVLFYYYVRAVACQHSFPAAATNMKYLMRNYCIQPFAVCDEFGECPAILLRLYGLLLLGETVPDSLVHLANEFITKSDSSIELIDDSVASTEDQYGWIARLVTIHLYLLAEHSNGLRKATASDEGKYNSGLLVLLHLTVRLLDWIARLCLSHENRYGALVGFVTLILWLRQQATDNLVALDSALRMCATPMSEDSVSLLNSLMNDGIKSGLPHVISHIDLNWRALFELPEIVILQGFQPLRVPVRHDVFSAPLVDMEFPIPVDIKFSSAFGDTPNRSGCTHQHRVQFIVQSARILAHQLPTLVGWTEGHVIQTQEESEEISLIGQFQLVHRPNPILADLLIPVRPSFTAPDAADAAVVAQPESLDEVNSLSTGLTVQTIDSEVGEHESAPASADSDPSASEVTAPATISRGPSSGGLIENAELARFIQEQANQVAARRQRTEVQTSLDGNTSVGDVGTMSRNVAKTGPARLPMSAAFRRDLPPRYARQLQAEMLLQREETENRSNRFVELSSDSVNQLNSKLSSITLDQPAPLARKESEAPLELDSLLNQNVPQHPNTFTSVPNPLPNSSSFPNSFNSGLPNSFLPHCQPISFTTMPPAHRTNDFMPNSSPHLVTNHQLTPFTAASTMRYPPIPQPNMFNPRLADPSSPPVMTNQYMPPPISLPILPNSTLHRSSTQSTFGPPVSTTISSTNWYPYHSMEHSMPLTSHHSFPVFTQAMNGFEHATESPRPLPGNGTNLPPECARYLPQSLFVGEALENHDLGTSSSSKTSLPTTFFDLPNQLPLSSFNADQHLFNGTTVP